MKNRFFLILALGLLVNGLSGCTFLFGNEGYFRSRSLDYQAAKQHEPLQLPPGTAATARSDIYPIPDVGPGEYYQPAEIDEVPRPASLLSVNEDAGLEMRTDGTDNWLVASRKFEVLWEDVQLFFKASGIEVESVDPESNTIITAWLQPKKKEPEGLWDTLVDLFSWDNTENLREKFRVSVVKSEGFDSYAVYVQHIRIDTSDESLPETSVIGWNPEEADADLVAAMYDELQSYLADDQVRFRRSSLFSQNLSSKTTFVLTRDGNDLPVLVIRQEFNRAWISVGEALSKSNLVVDDRNRSLGLYFVIYGKDEDGDEMIYQLKLNRAEDGVQVAVQIDDERVAPKAVSDLILEKVKENL